MRYLMCPNQPTGCVWAVAQVFDSNTIDIVRKRSRFTISGQDYNVMATCPRCFSYTSLVVSDGKLNEEDLILFEKETYDEEVAKIKADRARQPESDDSTRESGDVESGGDGSGGESNPDPASAGSGDPEKGANPESSRSFTAKASQAA